MVKGPSGPAGGAANDAGAAYRRGVAAFFVAHGLNGLPLEGTPVVAGDAVVEAVALETDHAIDDILVQFRGDRLFAQAKRTLGFGRPMNEVATQWLRASRSPDFNPAHDWLSAVSGDISKSVRALATAIGRLRSGATSLSLAEDRAVAQFQQLLTGLGASQTEVEVVLARAIVLQLQAEGPGQEVSERGRLLLDGHVVEKGQGSRAWRELLLIADEAARLRLGRSIGSWLDELRKKDLSLTQDALASRASYLLTRDQATARYRRLLRDRGEYVDLTSIGLGIPPIPLNEMDADLPIQIGGANKDDSGDLLWTFRRRGRVTLTGLPGGGKSIAMGAIGAEWATRDNWSLPIAVSLKKVAGRDQFRKKPLRDALLETALEIVEPGDRRFVSEALDDALRNGNAVLFLDGLDEAADRSLLLVSDIAQLLKDIHPDTDVLLATRDVAYADTKLLGFDDLRLGSPRHASRPIAAVLRALATQRGMIDADDWVAARLEWVKQIIKADSQLSETPLIPVLLASLAADRKLEDLPRTRALILEHVVEDVVRRSEARREIHVSGLPYGHETDAILGTFPQIAVALTNAGGSAPRSRLDDQIGKYLQADWGLPPGTARATAGQILRFWDDSGIFVASGSEKTVTPRLRLFLEIGTALHAASRPESEAIAWLDSVALQPESRETLILAAGRSSIIAEALIRRASQEGSDDLAFASADALAQGAPATESVVRILILRLVPLLTTGDDQAWRVFRRLSTLPVPPDLQDPILRAISDSFTPEHSAIARAHAGLNWQWQPDKLNECLDAAVRVKRLPILKRNIPDGGVEKLPILKRRTPGGRIDLESFSDRLLMRVREQAATHLLPSRPDLAPIVAEWLAHGSFATFESLSSLLSDNGHEDLVKAARERVFGSFRLSEQVRRDYEEMGESMNDLLAMIASLAPPAVLTHYQKCRLRDLASCVETLNLNEPSAWLTGDKWRPIQSQFNRLIIALAGFDQTVLAAQALAVQTEIAEDPIGSHSAFFSLFDLAEARDLTQWLNVSDTDAARKLLLSVLHAPSGAARVAATALATHPDPGGTAPMIGAVLTQIPRRSVIWATWAYLTLTNGNDDEIDRLAHSTSGSIREAIARLIPYTQDGHPTELARHFAADPVRQVRLAIIDRVKADAETSTLETVAFLEGIVQSPDPAFVCHHCGAQNTDLDDSCESCHIVTGRPSKEAARAIEILTKGAST
jgi:hypothetical protein